MVDLTLFHQVPDGNYRAKDKLNSRTSRAACYFFEWTGWYNQNIAQRLLGHYRLFQIYKKDPDNTSRDINLAQAYVLQYRSNHFVKYSLSRLISLIYRIFTLGRPYLPVETETFNRSLINEYADILHTFLTDAETDFTSAFQNAMKRLNNVNPNNPSGQSKELSQPFQIQVRPTFINIQSDLHINNTFNTQRNDFHTHHNYENDYSSHTHINNSPNAKEGAKGKEKDVLSKKQVLILFDLLSESADLEKIDLRKPNKYDDYAILLHAITGKSTASWKEVLNDYKTKDLYEFHTPGELNQLIVTITNLAEFLRKAGFHSLAKSADKKIIELEKQKRIE
jgi:hypothetical protein